MWVVVVVALLALTVRSECPNACSFHGKCWAYDVCSCWKGWMGNDCSQRMCQFDRAHADTPKGDLNSNGAITGPSKVVVRNDQVHPYGTTEQYPNLVDSQGTVLLNTGHDWRECSNKGLCDRTTGICRCFPGYTGSTCQRNNCPVDGNGRWCSGHGMCRTAHDVATLDHNNTYRLWDADVTMRCTCDEGYEGPDCSKRSCPAGVDPMYAGVYTNVRYSNFTFIVYTMASSNTLYGTYQIVLYDFFGHPWLSKAITYGDSCLQVIKALEAIPNHVVPYGTVLCQENPYKNTATYPYGQLASDVTIPIFSTSMYVKIKFTLAFSGNPGYLRQPSISIKGDGKRPTLYSPQDFVNGMTQVSSSVAYKVFPNGFAGETQDMVSNYCDGVLVQLSTTGINQIVLSSNTQARMLKRCLGDSDGNMADNVDVYNWDTGFTAFSDPTYTYTKNKFLTNPHLIKLVDATPDLQLDKYGNPTGNLIDKLSTTLDDEFAATRTPRVKLCNRDFYASTTVDTATATCGQTKPPGFYAVVYFDTTTNLFHLVTQAPRDYGASTWFHVYTTTGYLQLVSPYAFATTVNSANSFSGATGSLLQSYYSNTVYLTPTLLGTSAYPSYHGELDCQSNPVGKNGALDCLNKGDLVMLLNTDLRLGDVGLKTPTYPNLYTVQRVQVDPSPSPAPVAAPTADTAAQLMTQRSVVLDFGVNAVYDTVGTGTNGAAVYKFYPPTDYTYVSQCSGRGVCDNKQGTCNCFSGFSGGSCGTYDVMNK